MTDTVEQTKPRMVFNPAKVSEDIGLPPEEKKLLPAPTIIGNVQTMKTGFYVDIRDHLGRDWRIAAKEWQDLRYKLRYFKTLDRGTIDVLFAFMPKKPIAMSMWCPVKGWRCAECKTPARSEPRDQLRWCCPKCGTEGDAASPMFEEYKEEPPKPKRQKVEAVPVAVETPIDPTKGMSLKERLALRKAK